MEMEPVEEIMDLIETVYNMLDRFGGYKGIVYEVVDAAIESWTPFEEEEEDGSSAS